MVKGDVGSPGVAELSLRGAHMFWCLDASLKAAYASLVQSKECGCWTAIIIKAERYQAKEAQRWLNCCRQWKCSDVEGQRLSGMTAAYLLYCVQLRLTVFGRRRFLGSALATAREVCWKFRGTRGVAGSSKARRGGVKSTSSHGRSLSLASKTWQSSNGEHVRDGIPQLSHAAAL